MKPLFEAIAIVQVVINGQHSNPAFIPVIIYDFDEYKASLQVTGDCEKPIHEPNGIKKGEKENESI